MKLKIIGIINLKNMLELLDETTLAIYYYKLPINKTVNVFKIGDIYEVL